jgi:hypothetical protein
MTTLAKSKRKGPGRPCKGPRALTQAERSKAWRERQKERLKWLESALEKAREKGKPA